MTCRTVQKGGLLGFAIMTSRGPKHAQAQLLAPYRNFLNLKKQEFFDFHETSDAERRRKKERRRRQSLDSPQTIEANNNAYLPYLILDFCNA